MSDCSCLGPCISAARAAWPSTILQIDWATLCARTLGKKWIAWKKTTHLFRKPWSNKGHLKCIAVRMQCIEWFGRNSTEHCEYTPGKLIADWNEKKKMQCITTKKYIKWRKKIAAGTKSIKNNEIDGVFIKKKQYVITCLCCDCNTIAW